MKSKVLSIILCIAMVMGLGTASVFADSTSGSAVTVETPEAVYTITLQAGNHGTFTADKTTAAALDTVTLTAEPREGNSVSSVTAKDASGTAIDVVKKSETVYTFTMPASDVIAEGIFQEDSTTTSAAATTTTDAAVTETAVTTAAPAEDTTQNTQLPFTDVKSTDWFYNAVAYVYQNKLMNGVTDTTFEPNLPTSRGMIATIIYRMAGSPAVTAANPFTDVKAGSYYEKAIIWCNEQGIVNGYGEGLFGPDDNITREQLAAFLYRYAKTKGYGFVGSWVFLLDFADRDQISEYADEALHWVTMKGIMGGTGNKMLEPKANATRAQVAQMLMKFQQVLASEEPTSTDALSAISDVKDAASTSAAATAAAATAAAAGYEGKYEAPASDDTDAKNEVIIEKTSEKEGYSYKVEVGIYRLSTFDGYAAEKDGVLELSLGDPNEQPLKATFGPSADKSGEYVLKFTSSTWSLLPTGETFTGFTKVTK